MYPYPAQLLVVGYYGHDNMGDEQYKLTIPYLMKWVFNQRHFPPEITFIDCDQLDPYTIRPHTMVFLGGGDVLNGYFLDKIYRKFVTHPRAKDARPLSITAFSVGVPYNDIFLRPEQRNKLEIFEHIFLRTRQDIAILQKHMTPDKVHYLPDTSCFALEYIANTTQYKTANTLPFRSFYQEIQQAHSRKMVGIMLCRHIYHPNDEYRSNYQDIVQEFARMIEELVKLDYLVVLVPLNTKPLKGKRPDQDKENDILIQRDVLKHVRHSYISSVMSLETAVTLEQMMLLYKSFYVSIPMRFHATLFSVYSGVPMIPIYTTKKIKNFLLDIDWTYDHPLEKNALDLPTRFDHQAWLNTFRELVQPHVYLAAKKQLLHAGREFIRVSIEQTGVIKRIMAPSSSHSYLSSVLDSGELGQYNLLANKDEKSFSHHVTKIEEPASIMYMTQGTMTNEMVGKTLCRDVLETMGHEETIEHIYTKLQSFARDHQVDDFRRLHDQELKHIAVCVVSYYLTGSIDSTYHHGLMSKMFTEDYPYYQEWKWVWEHHRSVQKGKELTAWVAAPSAAFSMRFDLHYIDQNDRSGVHRSGWKYVYDTIRDYHHHHANIRLDLYVDRTFHWKRSIYTQIDVIPYCQPWMGFIHHTFDTTFSEYNNHRLMQCPEFVQSLPHCRGLIVLSKTLQQQLLQYVPMQVPVYVLTHPTEMNVPGFQYSAFMANPDKQLIHIGGWLRNIFSFYQMELDTSFTMVRPPSEWKRISMPTSSPSSPPSPSSSPSPPYLANIQPPLPKRSFLERLTHWFQCFTPKKPSIDLVPLCDIIPEPTEPAEPTFSVQNHTQITITTEVVPLRKVVLKGKDMNNYYPPTNLLEPLVEQMQRRSRVPSEPGSVEPHCSKEVYCSTHPSTVYVNNWFRHMLHYLSHVVKNVDTLEFVDNTFYDELLTKNVVFLNLVDGSAINTLVECLVRNTPVFVNRHPAVVEVLGDSYPAYFNDPKEVNEMLKQPQLIYNAHVYLKKIDKTPYKIETFLESLNGLFAK